MSNLDRYVGCNPPDTQGPTHTLSVKDFDPSVRSPDITVREGAAEPQSGSELYRSQRDTFAAMVGSLASGTCRPPMGNEALGQPWRTPPATFPTAEQLESADWR